MSARSRPVDISDLKVYRPPSNQEQEISLDDVIEKIKTGMPSFKGGTGVVIVLAVLVLAVGWAATGFYQVRPAELAALQLFGKWDGKLQGPGLHWLWPSPVGTRNIEAVTETRRMELGFRSTESGSLVSSPNEALMITGDLNIADVQMVIQYRIKDLASFLFRVGDPGDPTRGVVAGSPEGLTLKDATEAALRQVVGQRSIDDVLTINKEAVQVDTQSLLQSILDNYKTGIEVLEVRLQNVRPPDEVRDAFDDVVRANILAAQENNVGDCEIINIGSGRNYSVLDIAKIIDFPFKYIPKRYGEAYETLANINKARKLLNWAPTIFLKDWMKERTVNI